MHLAGSDGSSQSLGKYSAVAAALGEESAATSGRGAGHWSKRSPAVLAASNASTTHDVQRLAHRRYRAAAEFLCSCRRSGHAGPSTVTDYDRWCGGQTVGSGTRVECRWISDVGKGASASGTAPRLNRNPARATLRLWHKAFAGHGLWSH